MISSLNEIASLVKGKVVGDGQITVSHLSAIDDISANSLVFADGAENIKQAEQSSAAAILVADNVAGLQKPIIQVSNPLKSFITLLNYFYPSAVHNGEIHPTAIIAPDVILGQNISIGPYVVIEAGAIIGENCLIKSHVHIGANVKIGANSIIQPHVTIYDKCQIGERVSIHAASVIGSDGFGYTTTDGEHVKVPHVGAVIIENDVEIGANTVIDRATLGATVIGEGTKIDNLVQIAHSVKLGKHNILCAFTGIAGSTTSGDHVIFAANVGVSDHVRIDNNVILGARAGVPPKKHLKEGNIYLGSPARPKDKAIAHELSINRVPIMSKNLKALSARITDLEKTLSKEETL